MKERMKNYTDIILIYTKEHFKINNSKLLHIKAVYKHHSNDIKIDASIAIVLYNLNRQHVLPLFFL